LVFSFGFATARAPDLAICPATIHISDLAR
jgi:hypothetical protein